MQRRNLPLNPVEEDDDEPAFLYQDEMLEFGLGILPQHYHPEYDKKLVTFFTKNSLMTPPPFKHSINRGKCCKYLLHVLIS